uniref:Uncharacterized protein LOC104213837 n=1 Tax=Nicotiana sylvestris TaxID=4096 RepID=A0A1U7V5M1_NICSY|nr:PREDICTED: uncharacterized protein LOC104213837 [Nicotiana sylvestris]XP_009761689.1 PREDICTED: uncharacterized protein LOC104213837 [Nicotiana sylvestris]
MANLHGETISSPPSNPLFSTIISLYTLILLYFTANYQIILFSPVFLSTSLLLLSLLRLGQTQKTNQEENHQGKEKKPNSEEFISTQKSPSLVSRVDPKPAPFLVSGDHDSKWESRESHVDPNTEKDADFDPNPRRVPFILSGDHDYKWVSCESSVDLKTEQDPDFDPNPNFNPKLNPFYAESFVEWNVRAPPEVIHEEFEDGEFYYPETDTGTESSSGGIHRLREIGTRRIICVFGGRKKIRKD